MQKKKTTKQNDQNKTEKCAETRSLDPTCQFLVFMARQHHKKRFPRMLLRIRHDQTERKLLYWASHGTSAVTKQCPLERKLYLNDTHTKQRSPEATTHSKRNLTPQFNLRKQNNKINTIFLEQTIITRNISTKYVSLPFEIKSVLIKSLHVMASLCFDLFLSMCFKPNMLKSGPGYDKKVKRSDVNALKSFLLHHSAQY